MAFVLKPNKINYLSLLFIAISFISLLAVRFYVDNHITGDEPHYLVMDYSLVHDHDLNLKNNYQNRDIEEFYPSLTATQQVGYGQGDNNSNRWYSIHGIGIPILLLPGFWLAGLTGAIVTMVLISTAVIWLTKAWAYEVTKNKKLSYIAAGGLLISYSFIGLAGYLYPDVVIAALTLSGLMIIQRYYKNPLSQALFGLILGLLLLIHFKTLAVSGPLLIALTYKLWRYERKLPWVTLAVFAPLIAYFFLSNHGWFGVWNPTKIYAGLNLPAAKVYYIIPAFLFDSMRGLLVYNPVVLLIFTGLPLWYKQHKETFFIAMLVAMPSLLAVLTFRGWNGGDSQIGRYAIDFLPVLFPAVALAIQALRQKWQQVVVVAIFLSSFAVTTISVLIKRPYVHFELRSPFFEWVERYSGLALDRLFPMFSDQTVLLRKFGTVKIALWFVILGLFTAYGFILSKSVPAVTVKRKAKKAHT